MSSLETAVRAGTGLVVVALVGGAWLRGRVPSGFTLLERTVARLLLGGALASAVALVLADLGAFRGWAVLAVLLALALAGRAVSPGEAGSVPPRDERRDLVLLALVGLLLALSLPTFPWILGGRDPGTYVNAAVQIRSTHSLEASYTRLGEVPPSVLPRLSLWEPDPIKGQAMPPPPADPYERDAWPGMYLRAPDRILPQGYHLLPAAMAAGASVTGDFGLWIMPAVAVLGLLACALYAGRLLGGVGEAVTGVLLVASVGFVWYARYPASEMLDLALTFGGLWLALVAARTDNAYLGGVAGVVLGSSLLTRPDAAITVVAVAALLAWLVACGRFRKVWARFGLAFALVAAAATAQALLFARPYLDDVSRHFEGSGGKLLAAAGAGVLVAIVAVRYRRRIDRWVPLLVAVAMAAFAAVAVRSGWIGFAWLRWYMSDLGLAAAGLGAVLLIRRTWRDDRLEAAGLLLLLAALTLLLYGREPRISEDQFWGFRRFLPVMLPAFAILCGAAAAAAFARRRPAAIAAGALAAAFLVPKLALDLRPTLGHVEYRGASGDIDRLDAKLGTGDPLVLFGPQDEVLHRFGPALAFQRHRDAYPVKSLRAPVLVRWLRREAATRPVRLVTFGRAPPMDRKRLAAIREGGVSISLPEFDKPVGRLPDGAHRIAGTLAIWRLEPLP